MATGQSDSRSGGPSSRHDGLTVTFRGRVYPVPDQPRLPPVTEADEQRRNLVIAERLWRALPLAHLERGCSDRTRTVQVYTESIAQLHDRRREVERFFEVLCEVNLRFRAQGPAHEDLRQEVMDARRRELLERGRFAPFLDDGTLVAELTAQPVDVIRRRLDESLLAITESFVREIFAALDRFVGGQVVGLIDWFGAGQDACKFHFFSETIVQVETGRQTTTEWERRRPIDNRSVDVVEGVTHTTRGEHLHRRAHHEHHLMNAQAHPLGTETLVIPRPAAQLLQAVPDWLQPLLRIVEGDRIRERIIERDVDRRKWKKQRTDTRRRVERIHFHIDPALTLDCYVLTGWGEQAVRHEQERRELQRQDEERAARRAARGRAVETARQQFWITAGAAAAVQALAAALVILSVVAPPLILAAALLTAAGLVPIAAALRLFAAARVRQADGPFLVTGSAAALTASAGIQLLLLGVVHPALLFVTLGCGLLAVACVFRNKAADSYRLLPELPD